VKKKSQVLLSQKMNQMKKKSSKKRKLKKSDSKEELDNSTKKDVATVGNQTGTITEDAMEIDEGVDSKSVESPDNKVGKGLH